MTDPAPTTEGLPTGPELLEQREVELKYSVPDGEAVAAWLDEHYPIIDGRGWQTLELTDRYFDTPDLALLHQAHGARLRRSGKDWLVTLKTDATVDGALHERVELEAPATASLDPRDWPDSAARRRLLQLIGDRRLVERFVIGQERRERDIGLDRGRATVSLDECEVELLGMPAGELRQFEVELRAGEPGALRAFAQKLATAGLGLLPEEQTKLQIAGDMAEAAARVALDDRWSDAARKVLRRHLVRMLEREPATRAGDALALKQMRVATRRMRATWRSFDGAFGGSHARDIEFGLRFVAGLLGAVRDLDVLIETVAERPELAPLTDSWRARRDAAFDELTRHLDSKKYTKFVAAFMAGTGARAQWAGGKAADATVAQRVPDRLERELARMRAAALTASGSHEAVAWHDLRICAKRMRYALEAFRDVLDKRAATDFIEGLRVLQDNLGAMNDASVAAREATAWLSSAAGEDASPERRVAVVHYIGDAEAFVGQARAEFPAAWAPIADAAVPPLAQPS